MGKKSSTWQNEINSIKEGQPFQVDDVAIVKAIGKFSSAGDIAIRESMEYLPQKQAQ